MGARPFGARVTRFEDPALLSGRGRYVDDIAPPGVLHACFVRSLLAHARIRSIQSDTARAMPGVHTVLTAGDLPAPMRERIPTAAGQPGESSASACSNEIGYENLKTIQTTTDKEARQTLSV
jgi:CO/xanthine dehydrogenase Mo-binding subunit